MKLFDSIDGLFSATRYLVWGLGVLGIIGSAVLIFVNIPMGIPAAASFIASLFLSIGVASTLLPEKLEKGKLKGSKKYLIGVSALVIAFIIIAVVWAMNGGLPEVNLIFA